MAKTTPIYYSYLQFNQVIALDSNGKLPCQAVMMAHKAIIFRFKQRLKMPEDWSGEGLMFDDVIDYFVEEGKRDADLRDIFKVLYPRFLTIIDEYLSFERQLNQLLEERAD